VNRVNPAGQKTSIAVIAIPAVARPVKIKCHIFYGSLSSTTATLFE